MKVLYLTWGETPRSYGVFGSQVIGQFVENSKSMPDAEFHFASAVPIIHSGLIREKLKYPVELNRVKTKLGSIKFHRLPIYAPQNLVNSNRKTFKWMHLGAHFHLKKLIQKIQPDILHCRSYHASWAALSVKKKFGFSYKIIFDARGLWPEEVALKKEYAPHSKDYKFLKNIESTLLEESDLTIAVSDTMQSHYEKIGVNRISTVYLSANTKELVFNRNTIKETKHTNLCYVGALSDDTWHRPSELLILFKRIKNILPDAQLTIVTTSSHEKVRTYFSEFSQDTIKITTSKSVLELKNIFKKMDFGLMSYFTPSTKQETLLSKMVLAVKTAEYLTAGLPMIVNKACEGAAYLIEKYNLGVAYDPNTFEELTLDKITGFNTPEEQERISVIASQLFDYQYHARQYAELYKELLE
jgi:glycosyltransferase involved in cell wall biosynthesis